MSKDIYDDDFFGFIDEEEVQQPASTIDDLVKLADQEPEGGLDLSADSVLGVVGLQESGPKVLSKNTIKTLISDEYAYEDLTESVRRFRQTAQAGIEDYPTYETLHQDMFYSLYKAKPQLLTDKDIKPSAKLNHRIMDEITSDEEFKKLRASCAGDDYNAMLGTEVLTTTAADVFYKWQKENEQMQEMMDQLQQLQNAEQQQENAQSTQEMLEDMISQMQANGQPVPGHFQTALSQAKMSAQQAQELIDQLSQQVDQQIEENSPAFEDLKRQMSSACKGATDNIKEETDLINSWGIEPGDASRISIEGKREAIERIRQSRHLKRLTELIGKLKTVAREEQKRKSKDGASAIKSIEVGSKMESVLPSEKMKLANETTKMDFYRRYNQKELLQYQRESVNNKAKGPIICCIDTSGSMQGDAEVWSKAMAVAMIDISQKQKRDFVGILYDSRIDRVIEFERDKFNPQDLVELAERFSGGGTNFEKPLEKSLELIQTSKYKKADIVFITDGDCSISSDFERKFARLKEEKEFYCKGIMIDVGWGGCSLETLNKFCDDVIKISDTDVLKNPESEEARHVFRGL